MTRTWDAYIPTQKYRNDKDAAPTELEATGIRYLDVLLVESTTNASGYEAYECVKTCVGSNPIGQSYNEQGISADGCWRTASNLASAFIAKFIALDANIKFAANGQMVILDGNNKVVAGMTGSRKDGNKVRIWVGSENPNDAPVQINEDGSGHLAGGNVKWDKNGNVKVAGSLAMPIQILEHEYVKYLSFDTGFNFSLRYYGSGETVYLPSSADYSGVECRLFNGHFAITRSYMGTDIKVVNNGKFIINGDTYSSIQINVGMMAILQALSGFDENSQEISYWYVTNPESVEYYD